MNNCVWELINTLLYSLTVWSNKCKTFQPDFFIFMIFLTLYSFFFLSTDTDDLPFPCVIDSLIPLLIIPLINSPVIRLNTYLLMSKSNLLVIYKASDQDLLNFTLIYSH